MDRTNAIFVLKVAAFSMCVGALTPLIFIEETVRFINVVVAAMTGAFIGLGCLTTELAFLTNRSIRWLRKTPLIVIILLRAIFYSLIIAAGITLPALVVLNEKLWLAADFAFNFFLSVAIAFMISTSIELLRLLGKEATLSIFTGRYRRPRQENRIVLFADLVGSTALAERLGDLPFHEFLTDVSYDVSQSIERNRGEVHRYVGDAIIVTWPMTNPSNYEAAVACAQQMPAALDRHADAYLDRYGQEAKIRIALHCGPVAAGEIGTWKKEIALLGDTMNTAARIENAARDFGAEIVISDAVKVNLGPLTIQDLYELPSYTARGKHDKLALWSLAG